MHRPEPDKNYSQALLPGNLMPRGQQYVGTAISDTKQEGEASTREASVKCS